MGASRGSMAQQGRCSNCVDQSDVKKNSFMALNLESGLTWNVQASHAMLET